MRLFLQTNARPTKHGLGPQHQLGHGEGLGHVVVRSQGQAPNDILVRRLGGKHDDGLLRILLPDPVADLEAVQTRQHDVQQYQVEDTAQGLCQSLPPVLCRVHIVAVVDEDVGEPDTDRRLVLDHQ